MGRIPRACDRRVLIDVFGSRAVSSPPFAHLPRSPDIAQELPDALASLNRLYEALLAQRRASPFRCKYVNLNLLLSRATGMPVLSFASDDDGLDLACLSCAGQLHRLRFGADVLEIIWTEGHGLIQPLTRDDDHSASDADLQILKSLSEFKILASEEQCSALHRIALEECKAFLQAETSILGLDTWDGCGRIAPAFMQGRQR